LNTKLIYRMIVDHYLDNGELLGVDLSEFTKTASVPEHAYAWPEKKLFPLHTPEDALLSALYAARQEGIPEEVLQKIASAIEEYGLKETFQKLAKKLTPQEREALPDEVYGLVIKDPKTGRKIRKYPMPDANHVKAAIIYFKRNHHRYPEEWKRQIARKIVEQAKKFGVNVEDDLILRYAGEIRPNLKKAAELIRQFRVDVFWDNDKAREAYEKIASAFEQAAENLDKIASDELLDAVQKLEEVDKIFGVKYSQLPPPTLLVFGEKLAEETVTLAGKEVPLAVLAGIPKETYKDLLGVEIDTNNLKSEIEALPKPEQEILLKFLAQEGII